MSIIFIKLLHVLFIFIWIGSLLTLTRLLGYLAKEEPSVQIRLAKICKKMYFFVDLPSMILSVAFGIIYLYYATFGQSLGWFHMKLTFAVGLIVCDIICGKMIFNLGKKNPKSALKYKILHGVTALLLIGTLASIYLVRNKEAEIRQRVAQEINFTVGK